ncbi:MAG: right-handed parallel beta-helix repeat-containing protein [Acidobacteriota bacterium]
MKSLALNRRWPHTLLAVFLIAMIGVFSYVPVASAQASCLALCSAVQGLQGYGTGADDSACLDACQGAEGDCNGDWETYFSCIQNGDPMSDCWRAYTKAKQCSVCKLGQIDLEGTDEAIFVNNAVTCSNDIGTGGSFGLPLCEFTLGIDKALQHQQLGVSSKVAVCKGTYFDELSDTTARRYGPEDSKARVIVESVTRDDAIITGSDDWSGVWTPFTYASAETRHNALLRSIEPNDTSFWQHTALVPIAPVASPSQPITIPGDPSVPRGLAATPTLGEHALRQTFTPFGARRVTFSVYLFPNGVEHFRLQLLKDHDGDPSSSQVSSGAWFDFELSAAGPCDIEASSSDGEGLVEDLGNGWFRASLTQTFDTEPAANGTLDLVAGAQLSLLGPAGEVVWSGNGLDGVEVFGPQLDHRPLDEFSAEPRAYEWTHTVAVTQTTTLPNKTLYTNNPGLERWTHDWGLVHHANWGKLQPIVRRAEMIFVNGSALRQVLTQADLRPGTFLIDDGIVYGGTNYKLDSSMIPGSCSPSSPCPIVIEPPAGTNMATADVRVAMHPRLLWLNPVQDWEFRGLVFQHTTGAFDKAKGGATADVLNTPAIAFANASNLTLLENRFEWNNAFGISVSGTSPRIKVATKDSNVRMTRNAARYNGIAGAFVGICKTCEITQDEYSFNNWRGTLGGFQGHTTAGAKLAANIDLIIRGLSASHNLAHGLWLDYENQQVQVIEGRFENNDGTGVYFEANNEWCSPVADPGNVVKSSLIAGNEVGIRLIGSRDSRFSGNQLMNNDVALSLIGDAYANLDDKCYPPDGIGTPERWLRDLYFDNNSVHGTCSGDLWIHYGDHIAPNDPNNPYWSIWKPVMETMMTFDNTYSHVSGLGTLGFQIKDEALKFNDWQACDPALASAPDWCFEAQEQGSTEQ